MFIPSSRPSRSLSGTAWSNRLLTEEAAVPGGKISEGKGHRRMRTPEDILDRIARSGDAVMAIDYGDKIILWNKEAERLFGRPSRTVLGRPCYEIMGGRDVHGNLYCYRACPVAHQARDTKEEPVHTFPLEVKTGPGKPKQVN